MIHVQRRQVRSTRTSPGGKYRVGKWHADEMVSNDHKKKANRVGAGAEGRRAVAGARLVSDHAGVPGLGGEWWRALLCLFRGGMTADYPITTDGIGRTKRLVRHGTFSDNRRPAHVHFWFAAPATAAGIPTSSWTADKISTSTVVFEVKGRLMRRSRQPHGSGNADGQARRPPTWQSDDLTISGMNTEATESQAPTTDGMATRRTRTRQSERAPVEPRLNKCPIFAAHRELGEIGKILLKCRAPDQGAFSSPNKTKVRLNIYDFPHCNG